jgi:hypothetical protein
MVVGSKKPFEMPYLIMVMLLGDGVSKNKPIPNF